MSLPDMQDERVLIGGQQWRELPCNLEAEAALIGGMLSGADDFVPAVREIVQPEHFFEPVHARIAATIYERSAAGKPSNAILLKPYFQDDPALKELGGLSYLAKLSGEGMGLLAPREMAHQIRELALKRRLVTLGRELAESCLNDDAELASQVADAKQALEAIGESATTGKLPVADLVAWENMPARPKEFVWSARIPRGEVTILTGAGGTNKSTAAQQLVTCRAAGLPFLGVPMVAGKSLYMSAEDDPDRLHWMHEHICRARGIGGGTLAKDLFLSSVRGKVNNELATFDAEGRIHPTPAFQRLKATIRATGVDLVALDNVAHLFAGNENDRGEVTAFVNLLYSLGVTVLLIAHVNKSGDSYSGSTAWLNAVRSQLIVERPDEIDPDLLSLTVGKANYARPGEALRYRWHDFALWLDDELPADHAAELAGTIRATGENTRFLACLDACTQQRRAVAHMPGCNHAPKVFSGMVEGKGLTAKAFAGAMERLLYLGEIELDAQLWKADNRHRKRGIKRTGMTFDD